MLIRITSGDNSRIRLVRKLATRKGRVTEGRFAVEGRNLVSEVIERGLDVDFIMIPAGAAEDAPGFIRDCIDSPDMTVCEVPLREFAGLTDAENGIGMLAVVKLQEHGPEILDGLGAGDNILVLDRIQDPGNMGTLIRTAVAAGYKAIIAMSGTVDIYSPKVLRATAGMVFEIPVIYVQGYETLKSILSKTDRKTVVTAVDGGVPYYEEDLSRGIALIIGNEGSGVSAPVVEMADVKVTLPMKGRIESLNAAVAAAILMYEAVRGREG
ncbi:MAG: RNA methyltransferase [Clostridiales bacterium]|nr:RNA methyltransferase [Clostridiales bacterium]